MWLVRITPPHSLAWHLYVNDTGITRNASVASLTRLLARATSIWMRKLEILFLSPFLAFTLSSPRFSLFRAVIRFCCTYRATFSARLALHRAAARERAPQHRVKVFGILAVSLTRGLATEETYATYRVTGVLHAQQRVWRIQGSFVLTMQNGHTAAARHLGSESLHPIIGRYRFVAITASRRNSLLRWKKKERPLLLLLSEVADSLK